MTSDEIESFINSRYGELSSDEIALYKFVKNTRDFSHGMN